MFITHCHLDLHDFLFYASREMGRLYETEKYLHNYGLTYALGLTKSPYANLAQVPRYAEDLSYLNEQGIYVTPAYPLRYAYAFHTFKMANVEYYNFTPQVSSNRAVFGRAKELAPESSFAFYVLSERAVTLPAWIRLGKWMAKARVQIVQQGSALEKEGTIQVRGALNPLDLPLMPDTCNIVSMAPASLITNVSCTGPYYELASEQKQRGPGICLPSGMHYRPARPQQLSA
jgi:CRISPR-associated protein Csc1